MTTVNTASHQSSLLVAQWHLLVRLGWHDSDKMITACPRSNPATAHQQWPHLRALDSEQQTADHALTLLYLYSRSSLRDIHPKGIKAASYCHKWRLCSAHDTSRPTVNRYHHQHLKTNKTTSTYSGSCCHVAANSQPGTLRGTSSQHHPHQQMCQSIVPTRSDS